MPVDIASMVNAPLLQAGGIVLAALLLISIYNRLVRLRNEYRNAFSQIDVQLKRRHDLIPNLVETAKGFLKHEQQTLEKVMAARNQATRAARTAGGRADGDAVMALAGAEAALSGALHGLFAVVENYPDLKSDATMMQLTEELTSTENRIAFARQAYNDAVMFYNTRRESFPDVLVALFLGFRAAQLWEIAHAAEREPVRVSF